MIEVRLLELAVFELLVLLLRCGTKGFSSLGTEINIMAIAYLIAATKIRKNASALASFRGNFIKDARRLLKF